MPKLKTKRSAAKRVRVTASGKLTRAQGWKRHKLESKPSKRTRKLRKNSLVSPADEKRMRQLVPYL
jgi:large subunit ribosomal protein L35